MGDPAGPVRSGAPPESVGAVAELYLGNILYALELAAMALDEQGRPDDGGFYRGIARLLARAHGAAAGGPGRPGGTAEPSR